MARWKRVVAPLLTFVLFAVCWELFGRNSTGLLIPTFLETASAFAGLFSDSALWGALATSGQALAFGFLASVAVGIPAGLLLGRVKVMERISEPYINILLVTPMAAVIPILLMSVGLGVMSRVILIWTFAFPMVIVNTQVGVQQVSPQLIEMGRSFGANERQIWWSILIRAAMPSIMTGIRLALGRAIQGVIVAELLMVAVGVGGLILKARSFFDGPYLYAIVLFCVLLAALLVSAARWLERRVVPWASVEARS
jgi:ABC-type nitrate/sulfonate/bicarbonate transport system permease component